MQDRQPVASPVMPPIHVMTGTPVTPPPGSERTENEPVRLLRDILAAQDRQNELLEDLVSQMNSAQRQRNQEMATWKAANPELSRECRAAAEALSRVQTAFLRTLTDEVNATADQLEDGEFMLSEFVDRFGPRLAHLNGVLQVLAQLSGPANT